MLDKAQSGERLAASETRELTRLAGAVDEIERSILDAEERAENADLSAAAAAGHGVPSIPSAEGRAFSRYLLEGIRSPELRESRAAGEGTNSAGGYLVPPGWWQRLQIALKAYGGIANDFELLETDTGQPMQWATNDPTGVIGSLIAENTQISDVDYVFGQGTMGAYMFTSGVQKVSFQLDQDSAFGIENFIQARVGEALGRSLAQYAISGTGSSQPLGVVAALGAASTSGSGGPISLTAATKVNLLGPGTGSSTTGTTQVTELVGNVISPATVLTLIASVDRAYRALGAKFYMNDKVLNNMRRIADGYGRPFYDTLQDDRNPTLQGYPVVVDNNLPDLTASTASGVVFGHVGSAMILRMVKGASIMRLDQRYADYLQVGYIGYQRLDIRSNDLRAAVVAVPAAT